MAVDALIRRLSALIGVVLIGGIALWYLNFTAMQDGREVLQRSRDVQQAIEQMELHVVEAELALRRYLADGEPANRDEYERAIAAATRNADLLTTTARDDAGQQRRLAHLATELADLVARNRAALAARAPPPGVGPEDPSLGERDRALRSLRASLGAMAMYEGLQVEARRQAAVERTERMSIIGALALGVLVLFAVVMYLVIRRQLVAQRAAAAAVQRSEGFLSAVIENIPNMVFVKDARELRFERFNRAGEQLLGTTRAEMLGKSDNDFFPPDQARFFQDKDRQTLAGGVLVDIAEEPIETAAGRRWLHTKKVPILDAAGRPAYLLGISEDITAQKRATELLRDAKDSAEAATAELEAFSYSVAHDLRAPLRAIDGFTLAVIEDHGAQLPADAHELLGRVRAASQRMAGIIDALLALARLSRVDMVRERIDLSATARAIADELARQQPERKVEVVIEPALSVIGDARLVRRALENLLANAWKFTAGRADARIELSREPGDPPTFAVRDNGAGFDMAHQDKLFVPFQRLHAAHEFDGTGIGLATVARVIERHGGRIWGEGAVGKGATFRFVIPEIKDRRPNPDA